MIKIALVFSAIALAGGAGVQPALSQADDGTMRKACIKQVRASKGLQKGQPLGKGSGKAISACMANGGKL